MPAEPTNAGDVAGLVDDLLREACSRGASDLHLTPTRAGLEVTLRCNGVLELVRTLGRELSGRIVGRFKALAGLLVYRTDVPQEGRIPAERCPAGTEARLSIHPTVVGEKLAIRLETRPQSALDLAHLGLGPAAHAALVEVLQQPDGVVLVTGPSGSGKTTTLYACLDHLRRQEHRRHLVTVEDPVERLLDGVVQTQLDAAAGLTWERALAALLRQDPDVILVGEIRDRQTAAGVLEAGLTGHLVASTLHAGSCAQALLRLVEMGAEPFALTSAVRGVLSQRLVRRRCRAAGADHARCAACRGTGHDGRVPVAAWTPMTDALRRALVARDDAGLAAAAAHRGPAGGTGDLRARARQLVAEGITTQEEVDRVLGRDRCGDAVAPDSQGGPEPVPPYARADVPRRRAPAAGLAPVGT